METIVLALHIAPNPCNSRTRIQYSLPKLLDYCISIYNIVGQKISEWSGRKSRGEYFEYAEIKTSGIYLVRLQTNVGSAVSKLLVLK